MTRGISNASLQRAARIAGLAYLLIIVTSMAVVISTDTQIVVSGDVGATIENIRDNELLYRFGAAYDLVMFPSVIVLSMALYVILKRVSRNLALLALLWRLGEAFVGVITVLASLVILHLLGGAGSSTGLAPGQLPAFVELLLNVRAAGLEILTVFLCLGTIIYFYLFFKSRYIPRALAVWGMSAFTLMLTVTFAKILAPDLSPVMQTVSLIPVVLFELVIGLWLLFKGVNVQQTDSRVRESV